MSVTLEPAVESLPKPRDILNYLNIHIVGQTHAKRVATVAAYNHYRRVHRIETGSNATGSKIDSDRQLALEDVKKLRHSSQLIKLDNFNMFFFGPKLCGKWLLAKTLAQVFDVPVANSGPSFSSLQQALDNLLKQTDNNIEKAQRGIVYIDKLYYDEDLDRVNLYKLLKHDIIVFESTHYKRRVEFRLDELLFIAVLDVNRVEEKNVDCNVSDKSDEDDEFLSEPGVTEEEKKKYLALKRVEARDWKSKIGFLVDQFPFHVPFHNLTQLMRAQVVRGPLDVNFLEYEKLFHLDGVKLKFDQEAKAFISLKTVILGLASMRPILDKLLTQALMDIHLLPIEKVRITKVGKVLGEVKPIYVLKNDCAIRTVKGASITEPK